MMPDLPDPAPSFVTREPVVTAGASTAAAVALTGAVIELCQAYDWQQFTTQQTTAIYGLVGVLVGIGASLFASQKVTPEHKVAELVATALATPTPDQVMADAVVAQQLAIPVPTVPTTNIDDIDPGHHAGGIMDGTVADPFLT